MKAKRFAALVAAIGLVFGAAAACTDEDGDVPVDDFGVPADG